MRAAVSQPGGSAEVLDDLAAARESVLARFPDGSSVMTNPSVTLEATGIQQAVDDDERYDSARNKVFALDFVVGAQKLVPDLDAARERIYQHSLELEDARALEVYGANSHVGKILEIHQEDPGRIHVVLIRAVVGF